MGVLCCLHSPPLPTFSPGTCVFLVQATASLFACDFRTGHTSLTQPSPSTASMPRCRASPFQPNK